MCYLLFESEKIDGILPETNSCIAIPLIIIKQGITSETLT